MHTEVVLRADQITGDQTSLDPNKGYRYETIAGLAFQPANLVRIVLDNQNINYHAADGTATADENIVGVGSALGPACVRGAKIFLPNRLLMVFTYPFFSMLPAAV